MVEQEVMKGQLTGSEVEITSEKDREGRLTQVKKILSSALQPEEAPAKEEVKPRKRKERHESIGSITQERKVVRSNSEERPTEDTPEDNSQFIRRVSSHEDFKKTSPQPLHERNSPYIITDYNNLNSPNRLSPHRDPRGDFLKDDDCEHEKRRSSERFSRPLAQRGRRSNFGKKRKTKVFMKHNKDEIYHCKENDNIITSNNNNEISLSKIDTKEKEDDIKTDLVSNFLQLHTTERDRSPSPVNTPVAPALDLSTLHEQIDCNEPIPSSSTWSITENTETLPSQSVASVRMLLSPRNSIIMTRRIYMDTEVPMPNKGIGSDPKNPLEQRLKHVSKQINSLKKKLKKYEEEFECKNGYRPSHTDRMEDKSIKKICTELNRLRKEHKQLKDDPLSVMFTAVGKPALMDNSKGRAHQIKDTLTEIEKRLTDKRSSSNRTDEIEDMSGEELIDEKVAVQKSLLYFESIYGRPSNKEDRDLVRPLYDRYRTLKRMVARSGMTKPNTSMQELATIHEHETMDFVSTSTTITTTTTITDTESSLSTCDSSVTSVTDSSDTDTSSLGENLHSLPLADLRDQLRAATEDKKRLRRTLKEYENDFAARTGRKLQKDDRAPMEAVYFSYKQAKAKLRLLEALVAKHTQ